MGQISGHMPEGTCEGAAAPLEGIFVEFVKYQDTPGQERRGG